VTHRGEVDVEGDIFEKKGPFISAEKGRTERVELVKITTELRNSWLRESGKRTGPREEIYFLTRCERMKDPLDRGGGKESCIGN